MPRYYFHLAGPDVLHDEVGEEFSGMDDVTLAVRRAAAELIAEQIVSGQIVDLRQTIRVDGERGNILVLKFSDLFGERRV